MGPRNKILAFLKAEKGDIGEVRTRKDGTKWRKVGEGDWKQVTGGREPGKDKPAGEQKVAAGEQGTIRTKQGDLTGKFANGRTIAGEEYTLKTQSGESVKYKVNDEGKLERMDQAGGDAQSKQETKKTPKGNITGEFQDGKPIPGERYTLEDDKGRTRTYMADRMGQLSPMGGWRAGLKAGEAVEQIAEEQKRGGIGEKSVGKLKSGVATAGTAIREWPDFRKSSVTVESALLEQRPPEAPKAQMCATCTHFRDGLCKSAGPWQNNIVRSDFWCGTYERGGERAETPWFREFGATSR